MSGWRAWFAGGLCALLLGCAAGDGGHAAPERPAGPADPWEQLARATPLERARNTTFFAAEGAPRCPAIEVTADGREVELSPGEGGFAQTGTVTLVVFWTADRGAGQAAIVHARELVRKYRRWRVGGVSIVPRGPTAAASQQFAEQLGLGFPFYLDDLSALKRLSKAADAQLRTAVPSVFIIDRRQRLRFYRGGFHYALTLGDETGQTVLESAPPGDAIEDYLKAILAEQ